MRWEILDRFRDAAAQCGIPKVDDFNRGSKRGLSLFPGQPEEGLRWSAARGFLDPIRNRSNLTILTGAEAERIVFTGPRATGLRFRQDGQDRIATARQRIILAAGLWHRPSC